VQRAGSDDLVVFGGGSLGSPGRGDAGCHLSGPDLHVWGRRQEVGNAVTNNAAAHRALLGGIEHLRRLLAARGQAPQPAPPLRTAPARFGGFEPRWQPHSESGRILGH